MFFSWRYLTSTYFDLRVGPNAQMHTIAPWLSSYMLVGYSWPGYISCANCRILITWTSTLLDSMYSDKNVLFTIVLILLDRQATKFYVLYTRNSYVECLLSMHAAKSASDCSRRLCSPLVYIISWNGVPFWYPVTCFAAFQCLIVSLEMFRAKNYTIYARYGRLLSN